MSEEKANDWKKIFESSRSGLIPLIESAHSVGAIKKCTSVLIHKLFVNEGDEPRRTKLEAKLEKLLPEDSSPGAAMITVEEGKRRIDAFLHEVEEECIMADEEAKRLRTEAANEEKSALSENTRQTTNAPATDTSGAENNAQPSQASHRRQTALGPTGLLLWMVFGGMLVGGAVLLITVPDWSDAPTYSLLVEQMEQVARGKTLSSHVFGGAIRVEKRGGKPVVVVEAVPKEVCVNAGWVLAKKGIIAINGMIQTRVKASILAELCAWKGNSASITWIPNRS